LVSAYAQSPEDVNKIKSVSLISKLLLEENLFISVCASSFYVTGAILLQLSPNPVLASLVFWSTLLIYQVNTKLKINLADLSSYKRLQLFERKRLLFYFSLLVILVLHLPFMKTWIIIYMLHLGIISTLYNVPKNPRLFFPLRGLPLLKVFLISYIWASISIVLPAVDYELFQPELPRLFTAHFLFILSITLPFDIRDFQADMVNQLTTVPHILGINGTKGLALSALSIFALLLFPIINSVGMVAVIGVVAILIIYATPARKDHYYTFFVDGTIIIYFALVKMAYY